ncbi:MAG: NTP transferase domain-containing protein [Coriobacteriales bacterium]|jgi:UTP--glucose-1-phosphate uridylyltransferase|nr:NTP transferase domain-containing protein [Coriobacteriales bacterium]
MKAIIPAAGQGTRFLPASKAVPKEMLPVLDRPAIQYVVEEALAADASEVIIICNDDKPEIFQHFAPNHNLELSLEQKGKAALAASVRHAGNLPVSFAQQPKPLGLGNAVHCAAELMDNDTQGFYVLLGDVLVPEGDLLKRMHAVSAEHGNASVIAVISVAPEEVSRFGIIDGELVSGTQQDGTAVWQIKAMVEKPALADAPSTLAIFGRYLLSPAVMQILAHTAPGAGGEIQLTDALVELLNTEKMYAVEVGPTEGFDCGTVADWLTTNLILAARDTELSEAVKAACDKITW